MDNMNMKVSGSQQSRKGRIIKTGSKIWEFKGLISTTIANRKLAQRKMMLFAVFLKLLLNAEYIKTRSHQLEVYFHSKVSTGFPTCFFTPFEEKEEGSGFESFK